MADKIRLVQGDTKPDLLISLTDASDGSPIDLSALGTVVTLKFRQAGSATTKATLIGTKLVGKLNDDGSISTAAPYDGYGAGGRCRFEWTADALSGPPGEYEGEVSVTYSDGKTQTVYDFLKFKLRAEF